MTEQFRSGYVAIIGRPNVGKSTLLNHILGQKISITSRRPQTTRHQVLGIHTEKNTQIIFVDTPGLHLEEKRAINRIMNRAASSSLSDVDAILFLVDGTQWTDDDAMVLAKLNDIKIPVFAIVNKIDKLQDKAELLPHLQWLNQQMTFADIFPVSALKGDNLQSLYQALVEKMPVGEFIYPEDNITDRSSRFLVAEIIREKIVRQLGDELPYSTTVEIEQFKQEKKILRISAVIIVERKSQKAMVIGKGGQRLKLIGSEARKDMETLLESKIFLQLWVKIRQGWADDEQAIRNLGYDDR